MLLLSGPNIAGNEWKYVKDCLDTGWVSSVGSYVTQFENMVAEFAGCRYGVATSNGTSALHIALQLAGVQDNDYVIVPNVTFIASVNSIKYTGADPILMDVDPGTWQMDLELLREFLEKETSQKGGERVYNKTGRVIRAIMPVHVLGNICDMDTLMDIANTYQIKVVEDSTESLGSYYKGKHTGGFGLMGTFSFNGNKIITTGGGGVIVTNDEALAKKAKHLTTQAKSDPFEYIHDEIGYNFRLVNVLAAMGVAQMEQLPGFIQRKKEVDALYRSELQGVGDISFQEVKSEVNPNCWLFTFKTEKQRDVLKVLNENQMQSRPFWVPMNKLRMFKDDVYYHHDDKSDYIYQRCLSIPCSTNITDDEVKAVAEKIRSIY
ncbi:LegC family aminotransferase [Terrimonas ferruginea]|uniref:LegC family aminotransferase n=1 Tax=Terrimonas ferruginea TaxID=249 RepID=UPI0004204877|nr:LegC family aminotransferase [Terrimonas ferruginea]